VDFFIVQLRNAESKSWGNQTEISAGSPREAAQQVAGRGLQPGPGERESLRARVWPTPFGSRTGIPFYEVSVPSMYPEPS
jgi:hypothetical protein